MPSLVLDPATPTEREFPLAPGLNTIGRAESNGVCIAHRSLSRVHAQVDVRGRTVTLEDLESKNGTFVNGVRVDKRALVPGDIVQFGAVTVVFDPASPSIANARPPTAVINLPTLFDRDDLSRFLEPQRHSLGGALRLKSREANPLDRAADKLQILLRVSRILSSPESIEKLLEKVLDLVFQVFDVDHAVMLLVDAATGELEPVCERASTRSNAAGSDVAYSRRIVNYVRTHSVAALFTDAQEDDRLDRAQSVMLQSIRGSMCAPLKPHDTVIGVLYVDTRTLLGTFTEEDLDFVSAFSNQVAIAIENSRLYAQVEREAVFRNSLLRFFPPATIRQLQGSDGNGLQTIDAEVTALFCDISDFTAMSVEMHPRAIVELLNEYFPVMADVIFTLEGTLEKYIGDAMLAVWGAPFPHDDDPDRAVLAAIGMQQALVAFNAQRTIAKQRTIGIHIGVNTGPVAAGNIGSDRYIQYATIGDATNTAARICNVALDGEIVISAHTLSKLREIPCPVEALPPTTVKGKREPLELYRLKWREPRG